MAASNSNIGLFLSLGITIVVFENALVKLMGIIAASGTRLFGLAVSVATFLYVRN